MKFSSDSIFVIGKTHVKQNKPCQDHALSESIGDSAAIMVVSDGCSSGGNTDIGAAVISCATIKVLKELITINNIYVNESISIIPQFVHDKLMMIVENTQMSLGRNYKDFLATCVYSIVTEYGGFIHMLGDGCVLIKYTTGEAQFIKTEWENNMPFYPIYSNDRKEIFISDHQKIENGTKALKISEFLIDKDGSYNIDEDKYIDVIQAVNGYVLPISKSDLEVIDFICIFSDGLEDFREGQNSIGNKKDPIVDSLIKQFTSFKSAEGEFVKRRVSRALSDFAKTEIYPYDDFSMASIHVKH